MVKHHQCPKLPQKLIWSQSPIPVLSARNQAATAVPGLQNIGHVWKQTVASQFPKHGAMHRVLPTHLLSQPFTHKPGEIVFTLHERITHEMAMGPQPHTLPEAPGHATLSPARF